MKPEQKHQVIEQLQEEGHHVLMIGDGINDSAALSLANVGVVMAGASDIARQASDILFLNEQLTGLEVLENITEQLNRQLDANLKHTVGINSFLMGLGLIDIVSPSLLAVLHNVTTTFIIGKSLTYIQ